MIFYSKPKEKKPMILFKQNKSNNKSNNPVLQVYSKIYFNFAWNIPQSWIAPSVLEHVDYMDCSHTLITATTEYTNFNHGYV